MKFLKWIFGGLLLVLGVVALVLHKVSGKKELGSAAVAAIEAAHRPAIEAEQAKLDALKSDMNARAVDIALVRSEVARRKEKLVDTYAATGMSTEEVADRLARLKL